MFSDQGEASHQDLGSTETSLSDFIERTVREHQEVCPLLDEVIDQLEQAGYTSREAFAVRLAMEEAVVNGIKHGHGNDPTKTVTIRYHINARGVTVEVEDEGPGFDPSAVPDPLAPENIERANGRGLFLMRAYMNWVKHNTVGNCVTMFKARGPE